MTPEQKNEVEQVVKDVLRQVFGNYLASDGKIIIPKTIQVLPPNGFNGSLGVSGGTAGVYGNATTQAAAILAPTNPGAVYSQAEAQSAVTAINSIRSALSDFGITG